MALLVKESGEIVVVTKEELLNPDDPRPIQRLIGAKRLELVFWKGYHLYVSESPDEHDINHAISYICRAMICGDVLITTPSFGERDTKTFIPMTNEEIDNLKSILSYPTN